MKKSLIHVYSSRLTKGEEELLRDLRKAMETTLATETDMNVTTDRLLSCPSC